jgi:hypothetical protein
MIEYVDLSEAGDFNVRNANSAPNYLTSLYGPSALYRSELQ